MNKVCSRCKEDKDVTDFYVDIAATSGFKSHCRACSQESSKTCARRRSQVRKLEELGLPIPDELKSKPIKPRKTSVDGRTRYEHSIEYASLKNCDLSAIQFDPAYRMFVSARNRAIANELPFDITIGWCEYNTPEICPVLGIKLESSLTGSSQPSSPSLDRLVPELGYVKSNCRVISQRANHLKNNASIEELKAIVAYMERELPAS
jgi:hypothetical protein